MKRTTLSLMAAALLILITLAACSTVAETTEVPTPTELAEPSEELESTPTAELEATAVEVGEPEITRPALLIPGYAAKDSEGNYFFIDYFNRIATEKDFVAFTTASIRNDKEEHINAMEQVAKGTVIQNIPSWQTAKEIFEQDQEEGGRLIDLIDCIMYDLELWEHSLNEWEDIDAAFAEMKKIADQYDMCLMGHLSGRLEQQSPGGVEQLAAYVDYYHIAWFAYPEREGIDAYISYLEDKVSRARAVNPSIKIIMSISVTKEDLSQDELFKFIQQAGLKADAVGLFSYGRRDNFERMSSLVERVQDSQ
jgi:hypothetical protein